MFPKNLTEKLPPGIRQVAHATFTGASIGAFTGMTAGVLKQFGVQNQYQPGHVPPPPHRPSYKPNPSWQYRENQRSQYRYPPGKNHAR